MTVCSFHDKLLKKKPKPTKYPYYLSHSFFIHTSTKKVDFLPSSWQTEIVLKLLTTYFLVKQNNHFEFFAVFHYLFGDFCLFICFHDLSNFEILHPFLAHAFQLILDFYLSLYKKIDIVGEMQTLIPFWLGYKISSTVWADYLAVFLKI